MPPVGPTSSASAVSGNAASVVPPAAPPWSAAPQLGVPVQRLRRQRRLAWLVAGAALLTLAAGAGWAIKRQFDAQSERIEALERARALAQQQAESAVAQARQSIEALGEELQSLQNQRATLDQLYLDLMRGRDEAALLEVERLIALAAQELQVTGHVPTALGALVAADARLARMERPQMVALRRALVRDIDRLRSVPVVDSTGIALKLDQLAAAVDGWLLLAEPRGAGSKAEARTDKSVPKAAPRSVAPAEAGWWPRVRTWLAGEFGDLVRVREVDTPEALLLSPVQQQLVRQQFKLRLLNARQALLARNERVFRADLAEAQVLLARYFDTQQPAVGAAVAQLKSLGATPFAVEVPSLADTLAALRTARPAAR